MFQQMLAPLDGSPLAEVALPFVAALAEQLDAQVTLFHVVENAAPEQVHGQPHLRDAEAARAYLAKVAKRYFSAPQRVQQHVHGSRVLDVAQSIVAHTEELNSDLIVMCTHGASALQSRLFGSIAQRVITLGDVPVLLINPDAPPTPFACHQLLVPLDGNPEHEQGLSVATQLAQTCHAAIDLLMVIPTAGSLPPIQAATGRFLPATTAALLDQTEQAAVAALQQQAQSLNDQGITATSSVRRGDPAATIATVAGTSNADVVVLGTHGKTNMAAFWSGSMTPKLVAMLHTPLLLVPIHDPLADSPWLRPL